MVASYQFAAGMTMIMRDLRPRRPVGQSLFGQEIFLRAG